ncbi:N-formylglutamate deformylase [Rhodospirillum centenum]|uniref:N-formylglutamate amidohydrolase n=1 Tax=Rhodospirillum centenum (strain ATCC 51521 / SW) TaxID=414684 RepID=B6IWC5_RHOCS|nr:N-formylglutamate deformylase [Rhodospirillum centenum]ACJ00599.1 N-formylglutamate amidohydrolase [Rhodospirillum centenum SW]
MTPYRFVPGTIPLLVSMPHVGTGLPDGLADRLAPAARDLPDTDWHVDALYDFLGGLGASVIVATRSRYLVDLNRPADDASLYPGQTTTGLFPDTTFAGGPVWAKPVTEAERSAFRADIWQPYHDRIAAELARLRDRFGHALLWDAHSIAPVLPRLFDGRLPDLNLGSNGGLSCPPSVARAVLAAAGDDHTAVLDGRFKGGHITRQYGRPAERVLALQLELSQATHLAEGPPPRLDPAKAGALRPVLRRMIETFLSAAADHFATLPPAAPLPESPR